MRPENEIQLRLGRSIGTDAPGWGGFWDSGFWALGSPLDLRPRPGLMLNLGLDLTSHLPETV